MNMSNSDPRIVENINIRLSCHVCTRRAILRLNVFENEPGIKAESRESSAAHLIATLLYKPKYAERDCGEDQSESWKYVDEYKRRMSTTTVDPTN